MHYPCVPFLGHLTGGPEVAAAMLGWENVFHCEINPFGRRVLEYWFPNSESYEDITKTNFTKWRGRIDVLTGGFPCQPFSYAGKRGGREDERYLWPEMLRAIDEIRPTWVIGENVAGITTMVEGGVLTEVGSERTLFEEDNLIHGYELEQSFTIERICRDLERAGYSVQPVLIPAAAVGAPHRRDRIFILAHVADTDCGDGATAHSNSTGLQEPEQPRGREDSEEEGARMDDRVIGLGGDGRNITDTFCGRLEGQDEPRDSEGGERMRVRGDSPRYDWATDGSLLPENRWRYFPTVSPVHRGNDGLCFRMDRATIPFSKWRTESLKAYGNAIVCQVVYEIFRAIEEVTHERI